MSAFKDPSHSSKPYRDPTPLPESVPKIQELGTTSAPLKSAAFFIGAYCKEYNDDFMLCKSEERDPSHCLKEGRRVTRCAQDLITKMREHCLADFDKHWNCLEINNHLNSVGKDQYDSKSGEISDDQESKEYNRCRKIERPLNRCMFEKLGLVKTIPGTPEGQRPIHEVEKPIFTGVQK